jgi:hypothetical protein
VLCWKARTPENTTEFTAPFSLSTWSKAVLTIPGVLQYNNHSIIPCPEQWISLKDAVVPQDGLYIDKDDKALAEPTGVASLAGI